MKSAGWLLVLVACSGSPAATTSPPPLPLVSECPSCPTCSRQVCPTCPECPKPPPEPVTQDWYCIEIDPPFRQVKTFCWPSSSICQHYREMVRKDSTTYGKPSACTAHRVAYCYYIKQHSASTRQMRCARTLEDCQHRRQQTVDDPPAEAMKSSMCERALNIDDFTYTNAGNDLYPLP